MFHACSFMTYWAGLYNCDMQGTLMVGVKALLVCAHRVLAQHPSNAPSMMTVDVDEETTDDEGDV